MIMISLCKFSLFAGKFFKLNTITVKILTYIKSSAGNLSPALGLGRADVTSSTLREKKFLKLKMCRCFAYQAGLALRFTAALPSPCLQAMRRCCPISQKSFKAQTKPGHSAGQSLCCAQAKKRLSVKAKQAYQRVAAPARLRFFNPPPPMLCLYKSIGITCN